MKVAASWPQATVIVHIYSAIESENVARLRHQNTCVPLCSACVALSVPVHRHHLRRRPGDRSDRGQQPCTILPFAQCFFYCGRIIIMSSWTQSHHFQSITSVFCFCTLNFFLVHESVYSICWAHDDLSERMVASLNFVQREKYTFSVAV